jgi:hypothetical protein
VSAGVIPYNAASPWKQLTGISLRVSPFLDNLDFYAVRRAVVVCKAFEPMLRQPLFDIAASGQDAHGPTMGIGTTAN